MAESITSTRKKAQLWLGFFYLWHIKHMIEKFEGRWWFLSNFYPCKIEHRGIMYPSVEHYYVAMKCKNEQMIEGRQYTPIDFMEMVSMLPTAALAKSIGKKMQVRKDWDQKKLDFMNWGVREKFKDEKLKEMILSTCDMPLIEGNLWHDNFWGQCECVKCSKKGANNLGRILMDVRKELRGEPKMGLENFLK